MEKYIGKILDGRYEILEIIGIGGMAVVFKAMDHRLNRLVAVKILKDDYSDDAEFRRRFHGESQAVAMLSHPNIVSVYDVSKKDDLDYIVMELIDGITLKQYMEKKGPLSWRETLHFSMQIAKALEHAHSRSIIHRDIKPHNVMILKDGSVKVADFGIARIASSQNTLTKEALGSVHYISPEQARGARVDNRTDIYSLGVVMYEMLTGRPPYDGETPVSVAIQHINGTPLSPSLLNGDIPTGLEQITMHAMCADLNIRYSSIGDMLQDMEEFRKNPAIRFTFLPAETAGVSGNSGRIQPVRVQKQTNRQTMVEREYELEDREDRHRRVLLAVAFSVAIIVLIGLGILILRPWEKKSSAASTAVTTTEENETVPTGAPELIQVPQMIDAVYSDIPFDREPYCFLKFVESYEYSETVTDGVIFNQSVKAGDSVAPGTSVILYISMGRENTMPDLYRYSEDRARFMLESMDIGLNILTEQENSDEIKKDYVIRTDPEKGAALNYGQVVKIYVSLGREQVEVPNLANCTPDQAISLLNDKELSHSATEAYDNTVPAGIVVSQDPAPGTMLEKGSTVSFVISKGKQTVKMVNVVGNTEILAKATLDSKGLVVSIVEEYSDTVPDGLVIRQSYDDGVELPLGSVVTLVVSKGPEPPPETTAPPESDEPSETPQPSASESEEQTEASSAEPTPEPVPAPSPDDSSSDPDSSEENANG